MWGSGPGHSSPARICCPGVVLSPILQHGEPRAQQVLILVWWGGTRCAPHCPSCLQESQRTPSHLFYPLFYSFSFGCIRFSPWCHEASMHTLQATQQGGSGGEKKKISSWKTRTETFLFLHGLVWWLDLYIKQNIKCVSLFWQPLLHTSPQIYFRHWYLFEANHSSV